ncbi:MAG TPA: hypothetical protein VE177_01820 [Candidatus Binatus sp.]|jgi:hypothetical protein|nr:hypothetical protein [Candidatus Binatus sp.]
MSKSLRLIGLASFSYLIIVYLVRGLLPESIPSTFTILVLPLGLIAAILFIDLHNRARIPSRTDQSMKQSTRSIGYEVQQLSRRIMVANGSSSDYYSNVLLGRLREVMAERASIETGMDLDRVRRILSDPEKARSFLRNDALCNLLYYHGKSRGIDRRRMMIDLTSMIGEWTP